MSLLIEQETSCPACKYPNHTEVWSIITVKEDPELKDLLLGGELNMATCDSCKLVFYAEHFLIYHESDRELMAFVYPFEYRPDAEQWKKKTETDFATSQESLDPADKLKYQPVTMFGLDELLQLVQREEEMTIQSDIALVLAQEHDLPYQTLTPTEARAKDMPRVLPLAKDTSLSADERLKEGLKSLLAVNEHLFVYRELLKRYE